MTGWTCELELASDRSIRAGSPAALAAAIGRGADLRIYTEFIFEEHIRPGGDGDPQHDGLIREVIDFRETMVVGDTRVAGVTTLRQPLEPPFGFNGTQPKMSYFLYQSDGLQACANLVLDDAPSTGEPGTRRDCTHAGRHAQDEPGGPLRPGHHRPVAELRVRHGDLPLLRP